MEKSSRPGTDRKFARLFSTGGYGKFFCFLWKKQPLFSTGKPTFFPLLKQPVFHRLINRAQALSPRTFFCSSSISSRKCGSSFIIFRIRLRDEIMVE